MEIKTDKTIADTLKNMKSLQYKIQQSLSIEPTEVAEQLGLIVTEEARNNKTDPMTAAAHILSLIIEVLGVHYNAYIRLKNSIINGEVDDVILKEDPLFEEKCKHVNRDQVTKNARQYYIDMYQQTIDIYSTLLLHGLGYTNLLKQPQDETASED